MTFEEFAAWARELADSGELRPGQAADLVDQRRRFDQARDGLIREFDQRVVGFQNEELLVAESVGALMALAWERRPGRMVYFEAVGYDPFGR